MSKSIIMASNTSTQTVEPNNAVNFGSIVRRYGHNLSLEGGNIVTSGCGYYEGSVNLSFTGTAGTYSIQVYRDGVQIAGAVAEITVVADTNYSVVIPFVTKNNCCCDSTITVVVSGATATVNNASIVVDKE